MVQILTFLSTLLVLTSLQGLQAVQYDVTNNEPSSPGGIIFDNNIGVEYTRQTLKAASEFIWQTFRQTTEADRKNTQRVGLVVEDTTSATGTAVAYALGDVIHLNTKYIEGYSGDVKREITGIIYHEATHVWQWNGNGQAPGGLIEGIADYVRLKADLAPSHWRQPGAGDKWDQGYDITAHFLDYCNGLKDGFVAELNGMMRNGYSDNFFVQLLGKPVDQLWSEYKAKYAK